MSCYLCSRLHYEQRMKERAYDPAKFEKVRFSARERFDKIVLECAFYYVQWSSLVVWVCLIKFLGIGFGK